MLLNLVHVNLNVTDLERSVEFYERIGFKVMHRLGGETVGGEQVRSRGAVMSISDDPRASCKIELIQSLDPVTQPQPEKPQHQAGVGRIAIRTKNLRAYYEELRAKGVAFLGEPIEIDVVGAKRFVLFRDPDGTLLELIEF